MDPDSDDMDTEGFSMGAEPQGDAAQSGKPTLKRGDACLACRRRRIRCSAEKPACATCVRLNKQCVYETGKSTSRIALLKARIADLESQLQNKSPEAAAPAPEASPKRRTSAAQSSQQTINPSALGFNIPTVHGGILNVNQATSSSMGASASNSAPTPAQIQAQHANGATYTHSQSHTHVHATNTLADGSLVYQSTNPRPFGQPDPHFNFDLSFLDQPVADLSASMFMTAVSPPNGFIESVPPDGHSMSQTFQNMARAQQSAPPSQGVREALGAMRNLTGSAGNEFAETTPQSATTGSADADDDPYASVQQEIISILPSVPVGREVMGGWFDPTDVPPPVRDHLLDLFFSRQTTNSLFSITVHLPRFYTRLTLPPSKRPHPGLLYSIYTTAARMSANPAIKQLETQFFEIADKQIRLAVAQYDRLLDALRGMALLTNYLFAKEKYSLGYHMCGAAVRLAISCGLDRVPSSVWTPAPPFNAAIHCTLRTGGYAIPPPEDAIDLAERIYAFWAVYEVDLCTAVAYLWHTGLPIEDIRTPFPRPMIEYELGLVSTVDDVTISSVLDPSPSHRTADNSFGVLRLKGITLLARVHKLRQEHPEVEHGSHGPPTPDAGPHSCSYPGSAQPAYATHPRGFARIKQALDHFIDNLPPEHKPPWHWDEGEGTTWPRVAMSRETSTIHFLVGNAYMQLWNVRALDADNSVALLVARRLVNVMYLFQTEPMSTGYDVFMITIWNEVAMVLVRETKRLAHIGEDAKAAEIDADLGVAIASMKKWGDVDIATDNDGADIAAIDGKMLEQLRAMSKEDWAEAMAESRRRYGGGAGGEVGILPCNAPITVAMASGFPG